MFILKNKGYIPEKFKGDLLPSPPDERDYSLSSVSPIIQRYPQELICPFDLNVLNQGSEPSCVGYSIAVIKQYLELKEKIIKRFDGSWIYAKAKEIDGIPNVAGTYFRIGLEVIRKIGAIPVGETDPSPFKIQSYARVDDGSFEGLKKAIFLYGVVLAGFIGSNNGWSKEVISPPKEGEKTWRHAVVLTGYTKDYLIGQNSWGEKAHNRGIFRVPNNYLPFESWVVVVDSPTTISPQTIKTGWVATQYTQKVDGMWKTTDNLNVREKAGLSYKILKILPKGSVIQPTNRFQHQDGFNWTEIIL